jgi:hypothetical protein
LSSEKQSFSRAALVGRRIVEQRGLPVHMCPAMRIGFESTLLLHRDNKSQQKSTTHGRGFFGRGNKYQQKSTKINRVSKSQQKSAKSVPVNERSQQKSAKIIRNHQKSSPVWTVVIKNHQ